ncbi:MAG: hypothetical protein P8104_13085 [Gammaproteobacteria bacterium]
MQLRHQSFLRGGAKVGPAVRVRAVEVLVLEEMVHRASDFTPRKVHGLHFNGGKINDAVVFDFT